MAEGLCMPANYYALNVVLTKTVKEDGYTSYFQCTCHIDHYFALHCFHNRKYFISNKTYNRNFQDRLNSIYGMDIVGENSRHTSVRISFCFHLQAIACTYIEFSKTIDKLKILKLNWTKPRAGPFLIETGRTFSYIIFGPAGPLNWRTKYYATPARRCWIRLYQLLVISY